jgi:cell division transport system permease protein
LPNVRILHAAVLPKLRFFFRMALSALVRSLGVTILAVGTIGVALAVLATFAVVVDNLKRVADELGRDVSVSAYLAPELGAEEVAPYVKELETWPEVDRARFVSSETAMLEFKRALGDDAVLLDGLPDDVLPSSIELRLAARAWTAQEVQLVADRLVESPLVDDVRFGQDEIERVNALLGFARIAALILGVSLCLGTVLIVSNTIRLTVYARRDEIEIMSLVGATGAFVRAPFVLEGAIQGLIGGSIAGVGLIGLEEALRVGIERGLSYAYGPISLSFVPVEFLGYLVAAGFGLGLLGSVLAVGKFLKL